MQTRPLEGPTTMAAQMVDPEIVRHIRARVELGWGSKRIARELGVALRSVKRYRQPDAAVGKQTRPNARALDDAERLLAIDLLDGPAAGNAVVVQRLLRERGIDVHVRTLQRALAAHRQLRVAAELATVRFETAPAYQLQIDFGEQWVQIAGERVRVCFFVGVLPQLGARSGSQSRVAMERAAAGTNGSNSPAAMRAASSGAYTSAAPRAVRRSDELDDRARRVVEQERVERGVDARRQRRCERAELAIAGLRRLGDTTAGQLGRERDAALHQVTEPIREVVVVRVEDRGDRYVGVDARAAAADAVPAERVDAALLDHWRDLDAATRLADL